MRPATSRQLETLAKEETATEIEEMVTGMRANEENGVQMLSGGTVLEAGYMPGGNSISGIYVDGGSQNMQDSSASKAIQSQDITFFELSSDFQSVADSVRYRYVYGYAAKVDGGALASVACKEGAGSSRDGTYQATALVSGKIMDELNAIVRKHDLAKQNGTFHHVNGLPQNFGGGADIQYASGESIVFSDNQSPVISPDAGAEIAGLIRNYIANESIQTPASSDVISVRYREDQGDGCYADYCLEGDRLLSEDRYGEGEGMLFKNERTVPADSMEKIRQMVEKEKLLSWKGLPEARDMVFPGRTEQVTFRLKDGSQHKINGDMKGPGLTNNSVSDIQMYLRYELGD